MIEDKLTAAQRIRLEAIAQANLCRQTALSLSQHPVPPRYNPDPVGELIEAATRIERHIWGDS